MKSKQPKKLKNTVLTLLERLLSLGLIEDEKIKDEEE